MTELEVRWPVALSGRRCAIMPAGGMPLMQAQVDLELDGTYSCQASGPLVCKPVTQYQESKPAQVSYLRTGRSVHSCSRSRCFLNKTSGGKPARGSVVS